LIISGASNIYPAEVESALAEHPDVLDAAVVGVPDSRYGEAVCAVLVPKDGRTLDEESVIEFVRVRIGSYKKPRYVVSVDQIPRNPTGKALKRDLARQFANLESERTNDSISPTNEGALDG
jgi:acyl-CoA synthetase (AMP-forming)/AMP-acid ligase II